MFRIKGDAVIDAPQMAVAIYQAVPALAIRIVDDVVKGGDAPKLGVHFLREREVVNLRVMFDEILDRSQAVRAIAQNSGWHYRPAQHVRSCKSGDSAGAARPNRVT